MVGIIDLFLGSVGLRSFSHKNLNSLHSLVHLVFSTSFFAISVQHFVVLHTLNIEFKPALLCVVLELLNNVSTFRNVLLSRHDKHLRILKLEKS